MNNNVLLEAKNLKKYFTVNSGIFGDKKSFVHAVDDISLEIYEKETLALVGESGCGKSTLGRLLIRLLEATGGEVRFNGADIFRLKPEELRKLRSEMQIIFQDPYASLNPRMRVGDIIGEPLLTHNSMNRKEAAERVKALMNMVGLREAYINRYPHQFSGGQRQRIGIARALALNPKLIICDEPVSALDVSIQSQILNLLQDLQQELGLTYLFISHDLSVVKHISERVCVMFLGKMCELGPTKDIYAEPWHPYTSFLIEALPKPDPRLRDKEKQLLQGDIPSPVKPPSGCRFHTRCPYARNVCKELEPELKKLDSRLVACHFPLNI
ncbi:MAG TPA: dipeptide ABC transporter ATP-binding protein [Clostridia bacterium]|nr:dipeptide ABC transporter ATP-binding protein [Clostridia bacterium]